VSLSERNPHEVHAELVQRVERLEAEVERLALADRQWADHVARLSAENEQLRARNKRLEARLDQILTLANLE